MPEGTDVVLGLDGAYVVGQSSSAGVVVSAGTTVQITTGRRPFTPGVQQPAGTADKTTMGLSDRLLELIRLPSDRRPVARV
jgi:hypothetical protein